MHRFWRVELCVTIARRRSRSRLLPPLTKLAAPGMVAATRQFAAEVSLPIPVQFRGRLSIPAVAAPLFLVSNPDLVVECCRAGIVGTFPALNNRSTENYEAWLVEITERLARIERDTGRPCAPYGVNLIVHKSNPRLQADLEVSIKH